jgi:hypothetical protein
MGEKIDGCMGLSFRSTIEIEFVKPRRVQPSNMGNTNRNKQ